MLAFWLAACNDYAVHSTADETEPREFMTDAFVVEGEGTPSDVLFFMDTSCSMSQEIRTMADHVTAFASRLSRFSADWQLAAALDFTGCSVAGVLTPEVPYFASIFAETVTDPYWRDGRGTEAGLYGVISALAQTDEGECNAGFLREEASLHIIFVTDERDQSMGWMVSDDYWMDYVLAIEEMKGPDNVRFSAVAGPVPGGCNGSGASAMAGFGYAEVVEATNGQFLTICNDWEQDIELLANAAVQQTDFSLTKTPIVASIEVTLNGGDTTEWRYMSDGNLVRFDTATKGGDKIEIEYEVDLAAETK